ncbi:DUF305 domain-containing protein [Streptomyces sp. NPDC005808]|uniref:DUF305 domain-containing protein n=1 Tax=Streptomyces sp. NPDC005808 TaxID=3364734 RepID=UPI00367C6E03
MTAHRTIIRRTALAATAAVAALVLAACSDGGSGGHDMGSMESDSSPSATATASAQPGDHNDADVSFATEMIQHHRQAIEMAELADTRAASQQVKDLATKIKGAQDPEIKTMSGWLTSWGEAVPQDMSGMEHGTSSTMPGMMSSDDMNQLEKASGAEFDTMFLTMMAQHHEGAIEMAKTEQAGGTYAPAKELAEAVVTAQTAEIEQMKQMLDKS